MPKYRKKPVVIEAMQFTGENGRSVQDWIGAGMSTTHDRQLFITTLEGVMRADAGDFIIRGVKGEHYPCKPDIFQATYESAEV